MNAHAVKSQDRVDLGNQLFVTVVFSVLFVSVVLTIIGNGMQFGWVPLLLGCVYGLTTVLFAHALYGGSKTTLKVAAAWTGLHALLAIAVIGLLAGGRVHAIGLPGKLSAALFFVQCLAQVGLGVSFLAPGPIRDFLTVRRGEALPDLVEGAEAVAEEPWEPWFGVKEGKQLVLEEKASQALGRLVTLLTACVGLLLLAGGAGLVFGVIALFSWEGSAWAVLLPGGALGVLLGLILLELSANFHFLRTTQGYEKAHLTNASDTVKEFSKFLTVLTVIIGLVLLIRVLAA